MEEPSPAAVPWGEQTIKDSATVADSASVFMTQELPDDVMILQTEEIISAAATSSTIPTGMGEGREAIEADPDPRASPAPPGALHEPGTSALEEVGRLGAENRALRAEVERLHQALGQLSAHVRQLESRSGRPKSGYGSAAVSALKLQIPEIKAGKVHQRLYLEFYDRQERKRALQESVQQARENEVLDIFKSQHPWLNALSKQSEVFSFLSAYTEGLSSEEEKLIEASELWRTHAEVETAWREQLEKRFTRPSPPQRQVPSPRSPASPQADSPVAVPTSTHLAANYYPLIISRLAGETTPAGPSSERQSPVSSSRTGLSGKLQRPKSSGALSSSYGRTGRKPLQASQDTGALDNRKIREGLRLLASKPGEASAVRSSSASALMRRPSVRCLL